MKVIFGYYMLLHLVGRGLLLKNARCEEVVAMTTINPPMGFSKIGISPVIIQVKDNHFRIETYGFGDVPCEEPHMPYG